MKPRNKQSTQEIAQLVSNWTIREYGKRDASYMLNETAEVVEAYINEYYPFLTFKQLDTVRSLASKIIDKSCAKNTQRRG